MTDEPQELVGAAAALAVLEIKEGSGNVGPRRLPGRDRTSRANGDRQWTLAPSLEQISRGLKNAGCSISRPGAAAAIPDRLEGLGKPTRRRPALGDSSSSD